MTEFHRDERIVRHDRKQADGRDLFYYHDAGSTRPAPSHEDERELPPRPVTAHMRRDPLTGDWIAVAAARQNRVMLPPVELDPLAPQTPSNPSEIPDDYDVAVFENRTPSFGPGLPEPPVIGEGGDASAGDDGAEDDGAARGEEKGGNPLERTRPTHGRCEVVCFSPDSFGSFGTQTPRRARTVIEAWADRTAELSALPGIEQVFPFENRGEEIGVTLGHPHGQIYSYPYVTPRTQNLVRAIEESGPGLMADILESERAGERVVLAGEHWSAYVPFAARWPLEVHMMPHRHVPDFAATSGAERDELALLYLRLLRGVDALYDTPTPYIAAWHQAPVHVHRDDIRLTLQLTSPRRAADKLKFLAGSEAAMGAWICDVPPEKQAEALRAAIASVPEIENDLMTGEHEATSVSAGAKGADHV